jgi:hypothetical protein
MTTIEDYKSYGWLMCGLIVGGAIGFFGNLVTGAMFADPSNTLKDTMYWFGFAGLAGSLVIGWILMMYFFRKGK